jgi:hypothetical protein
LAEREIELWFPNYGNNPGILSKILRQEIDKILNNFSARTIKSHYEDFERFVVHYETDEDDYIPYITSSLHSSIGSNYELQELEKDMILKGRMRHPGKVGFGIFVDIGLVHNDQKMDVLLPLYHLKEQLNHSISCRKMIKIYGFIDALPLEFSISDIEADGSHPQISLKFSDTQLEHITQWLKSGNDRLFVTKTFNRDIELAIQAAGLERSVNNIESIDPLTTMITCKERTNGSGIIGKLGNRLPRSPIGIFSPKRIEEFHSKNP